MAEPKKKELYVVRKKSPIGERLKDECDKKVFKIIAREKDNEKWFESLHYKNGVIIVQVFPEPELEYVIGKPYYYCSTSHLRLLGDDEIGLFMI